MLANTLRYPANPVNGYLLRAFFIALPGAACFDWENRTSAPLHFSALKRIVSKRQHFSVVKRSRPGHRPRELSGKGPTMKMNLSRREFLAAFGTVAASAVLAGCGSSAAGADSGSKDSGAAATSDDKSATATKKLIVGFDSAYPPYGYVGDDGSYTGFDLELAQETAKRNDWEVQLEPIDWDAKDTLMDSGAINCIWNGFTIEGRENDYSFSGNYMINAQVIVVKKDSGITDFAGLAGKAVITQTDSAAYEVLAGEDADKADVAATFASLETIGDYNTAFMQLESGAVDAVACDLSIAAYQLAAKPDAYAQLDEKLSEEHYAVGFKKGDDATASTVTETLKAMDADGFVKDLCDKYADQGISYENWCLA